MCWHPSLPLLLFGTEDGRIGVIDADSQRQTLLASYHKGVVYEVAWGAPLSPSSSATTATPTNDQSSGSESKEEEGGETEKQQQVEEEESGRRLVYRFVTFSPSSLLLPPSSCFFSSCRARLTFIFVLCVVVVSS